MAEVGLEDLGEVPRERLKLAVSWLQAACVSGAFLLMLISTGAPLAVLSADSWPGRAAMTVLAVIGMAVCGLANAYALFRVGWGLDDHLKAGWTAFAPQLRLVALLGILPLVASFGLMLSYFFAFGRVGTGGSNELVAIALCVSAAVPAPAALFAQLRLKPVFERAAEKRAATPRA